MWNTWWHTSCFCHSVLILYVTNKKRESRCLLEVVTPVRRQAVCGRHANTMLPCIGENDSFNAATLPQTFISPMRMCNEVKQVSVLQFSESLCTTYSWSFFSDAALNLHILALCMWVRRGDFLIFHGYHNCYQCFDTLSRGHRLGVNFSRKEKTFFEVNKTPTKRRKFVHQTSFHT